MTKLSVNINKIALLRNSRGRDYPNVVQFAEKCIAFGAHGITLHPRPDQRHATYQDAVDLRALVDAHPGIELNIEGNPIPEFMEVVKRVRPDQCTLVPDAHDQLTSDHGWDLAAEQKRLRSIIGELNDCGIRASVFVDGESPCIEKAREYGASRVELYTEPYAKYFHTARRSEVFEVFRKAAAQAQAAGLGVNAGHDLDLQNLASFLQIPDVLEVSIGHALITESIDLGLEKTIRSYVGIVEKGA